jgi:hypothetical protein
VLAALGPGTHEKSEEVFLVDHVQHRNYRPLDDLVFQRGERTLAAI